MVQQEQNSQSQVSISCTHVQQLARVEVDPLDVSENDVFIPVDDIKDAEFKEQNGCSRQEMKQISTKIWEQWQSNSSKQGMKRSLTFTAAFEKSRAANDVMTKVEAQLEACSIDLGCDSPAKMAKNSKNLRSNPWMRDVSLGCDMQANQPLNFTGLPVMDEIRREKVSDGSVKPSSALGKQ